jgi:hypothetical protein
MLVEVLQHCYYRNIKTGKIYVVLAIAKHSEGSNELLVCYHDNSGDYWVRPLELFKQKFEEIAVK